MQVQYGASPDSGAVAYIGFHTGGGGGIFSLAASAHTKGSNTFFLFCLNVRKKLPMPSPHLIHYCSGIYIFYLQNALLIRAS